MFTLAEATLGALALLVLARPLRHPQDPKNADPKSLRLLIRRRPPPQLPHNRGNRLLSRQPCRNQTQTRIIPLSLRPPIARSLDSRFFARVSGLCSGRALVRPEYSAGSIGFCVCGRSVWHRGSELDLRYKSRKETGFSL